MVNTFSLNIEVILVGRPFAFPFAEEVRSLIALNRNDSIYYKILDTQINNKIVATTSFFKEKFDVSIGLLFYQIFDHPKFY